MNISAFTKFLSVAALGCGLTFANNVVVYTTVSNTLSDNALSTNQVRLGTVGPNAYKMVGNDIGITSIARTLPNPLVNLSCIGCTLNFVTGTVLPGTAGYTPGGFGPGGAPLNPTWTFAAGGSASIFGSVDLDGDNVADIVNQTLMTGSFINSASATSIAANGDTRVAAGLILNSQNTTLNQYLFGNPFGGPIWTGTMNLVFNPFGTPRPVGSTAALPTFTSKSIISGSLVNSAVPEPGSVILFSSLTAILGIGVMRRRRAQQNNA